MKIKKFLISFIIFFISTNILLAKDRNQELNKLFDELKKNNSNSSFEIEQRIWKIWSTHPNNDKFTDLLAEGSKFINNQNFLKAEKIFTNLINLDPNWAEAWNKRATVLYMMGEFKRSQNDIDKVLELEKRHFGALAGEGLVNIELGNYEKALSSYLRAMEINPSMTSPKIMINEIRELIKKESI